MVLRKGVSEVFMEMAVIIVVLAVIGFIISQTLMRTSPGNGGISGSGDEMERQLGSRIANCWLENSGKREWRNCAELRISLANISTERVERHANCGCAVVWRIEQNFTKTLINYDGFNRRVSVELIRE